MVQCGRTGSSSAGNRLGDSTDDCAGKRFDTTRSSDRRCDSFGTLDDCVRAMSDGLGYSADNCTGDRFNTDRNGDRGGDSTSGLDDGKTLSCPSGRIGSIFSISELDCISAGSESAVPS